MAKRKGRKRKERRKLDDAIAPLFDAIEEGLQPEDRAVFEELFKAGMVLLKAREYAKGRDVSVRVFGPTIVFFDGEAQLIMPAPGSNRVTTGLDAMFERLEKEEQRRADEQERALQENQAVLEWAARDRANFQRVTYLEDEEERNEP